MEWRDEGVILSVRRHGETSAIAEILTAQHGRVTGLVRGGRSKQQRPVLQAGNAVWRANVLCYNDPELHQPRLEHERRPFDPAGPVYVRVERQTLMRLDGISMVFGIHTYLVPLDRLTPEQLANLPENVRRGGSMGETN